MNRRNIFTMIGAAIAMVYPLRAIANTERSPAPADNDEIKTIVRCFDCLFWAACEGYEQGSCRRHTPKSTLRFSGDSRGDWPTTGAAEWCGEFKRFDEGPMMRVTYPVPVAGAVEKGARHRVYGMVRVLPHWRPNR